MNWIKSKTPALLTGLTIGAMISVVASLLTILALLLTGLMIFAFAHVLKSGFNIYEEQKLTV